MLRTQFRGREVPEGGVGRSSRLEGIRTLPPAAFGIRSRVVDDGRSLTTADALRGRPVTQKSEEEEFMSLTRIPPAQRSPRQKTAIQMMEDRRSRRGSTRGGHTIQVHVLIKEKKIQTKRPRNRTWPLGQTKLSIGLETANT